VTGDALVLQGDALNLPLPDESVDLIITSPPYFALRSYQDAGTHYAGQIGSEPTPQEFLEALWAATREMVRVLKPTGSLFCNLGDKYSQAPGQYGMGNTGIGGRGTAGAEQYRRGVSGGIPTKSLMGLPWRYAIGCIDDLGLILRAEIIWSKPNGLPESVQDRVRRSHEQWFMLVKQPRYFSAVDEVREPQSQAFMERTQRTWNPSQNNEAGAPPGETARWRVKELEASPLGKLPGSVWSVPSEPLIVPEWARKKLNLPDHFAAFPQEFPRRIILGWSPSGVCVECGEGRRPVVEKSVAADARTRPQNAGGKRASKGDLARGRDEGGYAREDYLFGNVTATITGYACACTPYTDHPGTGESSGPTYAEAVDAGAYLDTGSNVNGRGQTSLQNRPKVGPRREYHLDTWTPPDTQPAVVLDPFGGTGTVAMVARVLGRTAISIDLSHDYSRLAKWRVTSNHAAKSISRTNLERQMTL
jgi:DNA modification methylase